MNEGDFFERIINNPRPVVVDFWAPWCGPCKAIEPLVKRLEQEYEGRVDVWKVNSDENQEVIRQLRIYGIPTLVSFREGQEVARLTGAGGQQSFTTLFESALTGEKPARLPLTAFERVMRLGTGAALVWLAYSGGFSSWYILLTVLGGIVAFSAVHDRCPIWQAVAPRLKRLFSGGKSG